MQIITQQEAIAQGLKRYFTGKPCRHGHIVERLCSSNACSTCHTARCKSYYESNREKEIARSKARNEASRDKVLAYKKAYRKANFDKVAASEKAYYESNRKKVLARQMAYRASSPQAKAASNLRSRIRLAIRAATTSKSAGSLELLGTSIEEVRAHLEAQFKLGMTWDNWSTHGWHIDHIKPCASFDLTDPKQQKACFHYTNLQPLWAKDNRSKHDRLDWVPAEA